MQLLNGRPAATPTELRDENFAEEKDRLAKEIRVYDFLDSLGIDYQRIDHAPAMTMKVCEKIDEVLEAVICKNLFLCNRQETQFYLLMMPGDKPFRTKIYQRRSDLRDFRLQNRNIWKNFWTSRRAR